MSLPNPPLWLAGDRLDERLADHGVSRREFLEYCGSLCVVLGVGKDLAPRMADALLASARPPVIWLQLQECTGCVESVLRSAEPTIGDLVLDLISLDYQHTLMAGAGHSVESALQDSMKANSGKYVLLVTGSIPTNDGGIYCTVGGRTAQDILEEAAKGAAAILAIGACAHWGSVQAARPNPTGAVGVGDIIKDKPVINIAGCPPIGDVVTATVVHFLTFGTLPASDSDGRPLFAYGARIHDQCPRRANFDAGQFVEKFDDEGARKGWCLYEVGCKGPATFSPCPIFQWNTRTSWPIGAGHPCIGCTEVNFWDNMSPFYTRLPDIAGFGVEQRVDLLGAALALGALGGVTAHAVATGVQQRRARRELPVVAGDAPRPGGVEDRRG